MNKTLKYGCLWPIGVLGVLGFLAACGLYFLGAFLGWPGGMGGGYPAKDYDARLTKVAATALPMIAVVEKYRHDHGGDYPTQAVDFTAYVSPSPSVVLMDNLVSFNGWKYTRESAGYRLWYKLGWDPSLIFEFDGSQGSWIFEPGDGRPEKRIILKP